MREITIFDSRNSSELRAFEAQKAKGAGFFYITEFSDNLVKIGSTQYPTNRMEQLSYTISKEIGLPIKRVAFSGQCKHFAKYEKCLHGVFEESRVPRSELFRISFERAVRVANSLISKINRDRIEADIEEAKKYILTDITTGQKIILISAFADGMAAQKDIRAALAGRSDAE